MTAARISNVKAEVLGTFTAKARVSNVKAEVLATFTAKARVSSVKLEVLYSLVNFPAVVTGGHNRRSCLIT